MHAFEAIVGQRVSEAAARGAGLQFETGYHDKLVRRLA